MSKPLSQIISDLGLSTNLKLCLDAGDSASYNPAVQTAKWLDTSGNGYDFYRGSSAAGDAGEPTFNGSAGGLSASEYFSFDGGDYLSYDSANEVWMDNLHKAGAVYTFLAVYYSTSTTVIHRLFSTRSSTINPGVIINQTAAGVLAATSYNGTTASGYSGTVVDKASAWNVALCSVNDSASTASFSMNNASAETVSGAYVSPSASNGQTATIGAFSNPNSYLPSGSRIACLAMWEGVALTKEQLKSIYSELGLRFGFYTLSSQSGALNFAGSNATLSKSSAKNYEILASSGRYVLAGSNATLSYSGEAKSSSAADYSVKNNNKKYIVRKDGQLLVFNSKQSALDTLNNNELDATSEINSLIDIDVSENVEVEPIAANQSLHPTYDINLMLQTLRDNAQAEILLNERKYQALLAMYERHIDEEEVELLLMAA